MTKTRSYNTADFKQMDKRHRVHFINSLSGYKSANLVGSIDDKGNSNVCIVSSVIHLGADPALIAFVNRPHSVERHTLENIYDSGVYTINHVGHDFFEDAHHTSARYPSGVSEFNKTDLTEQYTELNAPYVAQSKIKMGVEFREKIDIELNGTVMIIGEIIEVLIEEDLLLSDGKLDIVKAQSVAVTGLDEYHVANSLGRLAYAKPKS